MTLDVKLRWNEHVRVKRKQLNLRYRKLHWLLGRHSVMSTNNKLLIYNQILKPIWTYGLQLWGCATKCHKAVISKFQNKVLREIVNAPRFYRTDRLHKDLGVSTVEEEIKKHAQRHDLRLARHPNVEATRLNRNARRRRLRRTVPSDLV